MRNSVISILDNYYMRFLTFIDRVISSAINRFCELSIMNDKEVSFKNSIDAAAQEF